MSILWIIIIVVLVLLILGFLAGDASAGNVARRY